MVVPILRVIPTHDGGRITCRLRFALRKIPNNEISQEKVRSVSGLVAA